MRRWLTCALLLATLLCHAQAGTPDQDCLHRLLDAVSNKGVLAANWTGPDFPCGGAPFVGVSCDPATLQVQELRLPKFGLAGPLPPELALCAALERVDLSANFLTGSVPPELGALSRLASLNLSRNMLEGGVPAALGRCAALAELDLAANGLTGGVPPELGALPRLQVLRLAGNHLAGGIPPGLARFDASSFVPGNPGLRGAPLPALPAGRGGGGISVLGIVLVGLASGFVSLVVSFAAVCHWMKRNTESADKFKTLPEMNV